MSSPGSGSGASATPSPNTKPSAGAAEAKDKGRDTSKDKDKDKAKAKAKAKEEAKAKTKSRRPESGSDPRGQGRSRERRPDPRGSSNSDSGDLHDKSRDFRNNYVSLPSRSRPCGKVLNRQLVPSGGWLHDLVVGVSDMTGLSDFFVLSIVFVGAWIVLRVMEKGVSLILGLGFDMTIPLQHHRESPSSLRVIHWHRHCHCHCHCHCRRGSKSFRRVCHRR